MANESSGSGGIDLFGLLGIVFIVLKLTSAVDWAWWVVLAPILGPFALVVLLLLRGICKAAEDGKK